ncbi:MAG: hypothetical protein LBG69_07340 [Zoogloeaceae bacterium]|jgi:hypothetical protein|nr:hypothetical protein [Zoogloeaceae bacterium]
MRWKQKIGNLSARLLRAAAVRIVNDLELNRIIQATSASASFVDAFMYDAKPCSSRLEVMKTAFGAMDDAPPPGRKVYV